MAKTFRAKRADSVGRLKEHLIAAGENILERQGLDGLTLRATARAAGVSHMAPYRHFDDKDSLLAAIAERGFCALTEAMDDATENINKPKERLQAIGTAYVMFAHHHPAMYRLMFGAAISDKSRFSKLVETGKYAYSKCSDAVAACHSGKNRLNNKALMHKSVATWALVHGLASLVIDAIIPLPEHDRTSTEKMIGSILTSL